MGLDKMEMALQNKWLQTSQLVAKIDNGENSLSKFRSIWIWYLRSMLPF